MCRLMTLFLPLLMTPALLAVEVDPPSDAAALLPPAAEIFQTNSAAVDGLTATRTLEEGQPAQLVSWNRVDLPDGSRVSLIELDTGTSTQLLTIEAIEIAEEGYLTWQGTLGQEPVEGTVYVIHLDGSDSTFVHLSGGFTATIELSNGLLAQMEEEIEEDDDDPLVLNFIGGWLRTLFPGRVFTCDHPSGDECTNSDCCLACLQGTGANNCVGCCQYFDGPNANCAARCPANPISTP